MLAPLFVPAALPIPESASVAVRQIDFANCMLAIIYSFNDFDMRIARDIAACMAAFLNDFGCNY